MLVALAVAALLIQASTQSPTPSAAFSIREWLVSQPFAADTGEDALDRDFLNGEEAAFPDVGRRWRIIAAAADGVLDPALPPTAAAHGAVYACAYLRSARDASHRLVLASDADVAVWLNGQLVHRHRIAAGAGSRHDTIAVRLAAGWNTLLVKLVHRPGTLGFSAWLVGDDPVVAASRQPPAPGPRNLPAESFTASSIALSSALVWRGVALEALTSIRVTPWGPTVPPAALLVVVAGHDTLTVDALELSGVATPVTLQRKMELGSLARAALAAGGARLMIVRPGQMSEHAAGLTPSHLLALLDGRITIDGWRDSDGALGARVVIPAPFAGLTLDLLAAEHGPRARYTIAGRSAAWRDGVVELCSECREGTALAIRIERAPDRSHADPPLVRVRDLTYTDVARTAQVLAVLGEPGSVSAPDADAWLRAALDPTKTAYRELQRRDGARLAAQGSRLRGDTILLVGRSRSAAEPGEAGERAWRSALQLQRRFPGAIFTASSAARYRWLEARAPALLDSIREAVRGGTWSLVGDWWVDADRGLPAGESLVRRGLYGQREFERLFGRRCTAGWAADGVGSAWSLPQVLRGLGLTAFVTEGLRQRDGAPFPYDAFSWEGLDGTRIFAYNSRVSGQWGDAAALAGALELGDGQPLGPRTTLASYEPTVEMLRRNEDLRRLPAFPAVRNASIEAALASIRRARPAGALPTWRNDLRAGPAGRAAMAQRTAWRYGRDEELLGAAEILATIDSSPYPRGALTAAWQHLLFDQSADRVPREPERPGDHEPQPPDDAWTTARTIRDTALRRLARALDTRGGGVPIVVFNPASWVRSSYVDVPVDRELSALRRDAGGAGSALRVVDAARRAAAVRFAGDSVRFFAREIPPLGFKVFWLERGAPPRGGLDAGGARIENDHLLVELDTATGQLTRVFDKVGRREALATGGRANVLQLLREPLDEPQVLDSVYAVRRGGNDLVRWIEVEQRWNGTRIVQRVVLRRDEPFLVIESDVDWRAAGALAVAVDLAATADSAWYEIPYGAVARPTVPRPPGGTPPYAALRWTDLSASDAGVSILNDGHSGWDVDGRRVRLWLRQATVRPFRPADRERFRVRYALYPHAGDWRAAGTVRRGIEFTAPLLAFRESAHRGPAGRSWSYVAVDADNVYISAVKRAEIGRSAVLRLVEWHGRAVRTSLTFGRPVTRVRTATLLEDPVTVLPLAPDGTLAVTLRPWEIVTLLVDE